MPLEEQFLDSDGSLFVEIVEVTAGAIGSKVLSSVEIPHGFLTSSSLGFVSIQFLSPPVDVVPGIELAIQFRVGIGGYYGISGSIGGVVDPYEKGKLFMRHPVTTRDAWQEIAGWNMYFRALVVVEQPTSPFPTPAPTPAPSLNSIRSSG